MGRVRASTVLLSLAAAGLALPSAVLTTLGLVPRLQTRHVRLAQAASFVHWGTVGWALVLGLLVAVAVLVRRRLSALPVVVAALALALHASWLIPYYRADPPAARTALSVTTLNVEFGNTDGESLSRQLAASDVVALEEATPETVRALSAAGMDQQFPHRAGVGSPGAAGTVIYSRLPMTDLGPGPTDFQSRLVRVQTAHGPVLVAAVHPVNPMSGVGPWVADATRLQTWLRPHVGEDLVVAGDFNSVDRHVTMRPWFAAGMRDAADSAGAGLPRTWPVEGTPAPFPLIAIDHVLITPRLTATRYEGLRVPDTDHAGVRVTLGFTA